MKLHVVKTTAAGGKEVSYYLSKVEDRLNQYMEHNEHLGSKYLKSAISNAERDIGRGFIDKKCERQRRKDLANLKWTLKHQETLCRMELSLEYPPLVYELKHCGSGWIAKLWHSNNEVIYPIQVEDSFVQDLLTPHAYNRDSFKSKYGRVGKYDRQETIDDTLFRSIRRSGEDEFIVTDLHGRDIPVTYDWVTNNLEVDAIADISIGGQSDPLPIGSAAKPGQVTNVNNVMPKVQFQQGPDQQHCLVKSLASGMFFRGLQKESTILASAYESGKMKNNKDQLKLFRGVVQFAMKGYKKSRLARPSRVQGERYDPLNVTHRRMNPIVVQLRAKHKCGEQVFVNHAVCFVGDYLFDPNQERAMDITKENLDRVCSAIVTDSIYDGIYRSYELYLD